MFFVDLDRFCQIRLEGIKLDFFRNGPGSWWITNILFGALHVPDASPLRTCTFSMIRGSSISPSSLVMHFVVVPPIAVQTHEMHIILLFPRANKIVKDVQRTQRCNTSKTEPIYIHKITCFLLPLQAVKAENNKRWCNFYTKNGSFSMGS